MENYSEASAIENLIHNGLVDRRNAGNARTYLCAAGAAGSSGKPGTASVFLREAGADALGAAEVAALAPPRRRLRA